MSTANSMLDVPVGTTYFGRAFCCDEIFHSASLTCKGRVLIIILLWSRINPAGFWDHSCVDQDFDKCDIKIVGRAATELLCDMHQSPDQSRNHSWHAPRGTPEWKGQQELATFHR